MTFKEQLAADVKGTFLNPKEFGEVHTVDGREMAVVIEDHELQGRQGQELYADGIYAKRKLLYVAAADFGPLPTHRSFFTVDAESYTVIDATAEGDMYAITVEANEGL